MPSEVRETSCQEIQPLLCDFTRGAGDDATRARVQGHLETCTACQRIAEEERALDRSLEQLPRHAAPLSLRRRLEARLPPVAELAPRRSRAASLRRWAPTALAAAAAMVAIVAVTDPLSSRGEALVTAAVTDHLRVVHRERPVDIESGGPHQVKPWFTGRLDFALPGVFGGDGEFTLMGGSVGYFLDRQAAVLVYLRQLHKISLFVFPAQDLSFPRGDQRLGRVSASLRRAKGFDVVLWRDGELGYALVSDLNSAELLRLAANVAGGS
jgi:anti-sigma factor RsiW